MYLISFIQKGKQRGFRVGEYLRKRYSNKLISSLYLPDEITIRTTDYARTKMTALTALAAIFPPPQAQRWNPFLNWQPVPYNTEPPETDDVSNRCNGVLTATGIKRNHHHQRWANKIICTATQRPSGNTDMHLNFLNPLLFGVFSGQFSVLIK